ncbi:MAG: DUF1800 family protein [Actinomycetota bacterium]
MAERNPPLQDAALLARRATLRVDLNEINRLAALDWPDAVQSILDAPADQEPVPASEESEDAITWWYGKIAAPTSGLHERMTYFWHTILTTHRWASGEQALIAPQLQMLRANALGNYRTLLKAFLTDGALIKYLNADSSTKRRPNENLARELMELFTFGVGHYTEDDVRAAALAMTGWRVNDDNNTPYFDAERAHPDPVTFLGENKKWDVESIADRLCDHPATPARITSLLFHHFTGRMPDAAGAAELGSWWQGQNLEIMPLLGRILNDDAMRANHYARARSGFEFHSAMQSIVGLDSSDTWRAREAGQGLYEPPNVGGWPDGDRWLSADSMLRRANLLFSYDLNIIEGGVVAPLDQILDRCGLFVLSQGTLDALAAAQADGYEGNVAHLQWRVAMGSPEFQLT